MTDDNLTDKPAAGTGKAVRSRSSVASKSKSKTSKRSTAAKSGKARAVVKTGGAKGVTIDRRRSDGKTQLAEAVINQTKFDDERIAIYLQTLCETGRKAYSAIKAGVAPRTARRLEVSNSKFAELVKDALEVYREMVIDELDRRGRRGFMMPKWNPAKEKWDDVPHISDRCLEILARIYIPETRNGVKTEVNANAVAVAVPSITIVKREYDHDV